MAEPILILSTFEDYHAAAIGACLKLMGEQPVGMILDAFPTLQHHSFQIGDELRFVSNPLGATFDPAMVKSLWHRRPGRPRIDEVLVSEHDASYLTTTLTRYGESLVYALQRAGEAFAVNDPSAARRGESKPLQLTQAKKRGFNVPPTLLTNNLDDIRAFFDRHNGEIICKPLIAKAWDEKGEQYAALTTPIERSHLDALPDAAWAVQPAIFQPTVRKQFEIRLVIFGEHVFCMRIDSQESVFSRLDWRRGRTDSQNCSIFDAPDDLVSKCRELMADLGIVFACFDFAVDEEGKYVFFELNQAGQFLWMERILPDLNLCFTFASFLARRESKVCPNTLRLTEIMASDSYLEWLSKDKILSEQESYCDGFRTFDSSSAGTATDAGRT